MLICSHEHRLNLYKMQVVLIAGGRNSFGADANNNCFPANYHPTTIPDKIMLSTFKKLIQTDLVNSLATYERANRTNNLLRSIGVKKEIMWETTVGFLL